MLKRENRLAKIIRMAGEKKYFSPLFTIRIAENKDNQVRFGFVVSKRVDKKAVVRNRTKRVLRDVAAGFIRNLTGKDIVIVAKKSLNFSEKEMVAKELKSIFKQ
ncbi:MAG: ribonuclease P protein component [Candidatus Levyibacteriota bacterium]|jgi:ribonuclease P protein component